MAYNVCMYVFGQVTFALTLCGFLHHFWTADSKNYSCVKPIMARLSNLSLIGSVGRHWLLWSRLIGISKVATSTESATLFLAHIDGLYMVNLYRNVGKAGKLLNSADYESFSCLYFEKM